MPEVGDRWMSLGRANRKDSIGAQGISRDGNLGDWVWGAHGNGEY